MIRLLALTWWRLCYRQDDAAEQEIVRNPSGQEMLSDRTILPLRKRMKARQRRLNPQTLPSFLMLARMAYR